MRHYADARPVDGVVAQLRDQRVLLVLDNFEHLLAASSQVAALIESLLG